MNFETVLETVLETNQIELFDKHFFDCTAKTPTRHKAAVCKKGAVKKLP